MFKICEVKLLFFIMFFKISVLFHLFFFERGDPSKKKKMVLMVNANIKKIITILR
jgi:hypothetical protein